MNTADREYTEQVAAALRRGDTVHREILVDAARMINPEVGTNERTAILEQIVTNGRDSGYRD